MKKINNLAVTGSIGSGKSTVLSLFEKKGFHIIDCDQLVANLYKNTHVSYFSFAKEMDDWLGTSFSHQSYIDKNELRKTLESIENGFKIILNKIRPYIHEDMNNILNSSTTPIIFEVPLLIEAGMQNSFSQILVITCNTDIRKKRIAQRNPNLTMQQIEYIINQQLSDAEKVKFATFLLDNSGTKEQLITDFEYIYDKILNNKNFKLL